MIFAMLISQTTSRML